MTEARTAPAAPRSVRMRRALVGIGLAALAVVTVAVFVQIDSGSHSVSDTIRPFVILMAPLWALAIAASALVLRRRV